MLSKVEACDEYLHLYKEESWIEVPIVSRVLHIPLQYLELPGEEELTQGKSLTTALCCANTFPLSLGP